MARSLLSPPPYSAEAPDIRYWDDLEAALLRIPDDEWQNIKSIPGMTGDEDFDAEMRAFRAKYHKEPAEEDDDFPLGAEDDDDEGFAIGSGRLPIIDEDDD